MRQLRPSVLFLAFAGACATTSAGKPVTTETTSSSSTSQIRTGGAAAGGISIGTTNSYTAVAVDVPISPDSAFQVLSRAYSMLEIPVAPVATKRAVGNDEIKIRRRIAGLAMQNVVDCGDKMGLPNAETWDIHMNLLSYVQPNPAGGSQIFTRMQAMGNPVDLSNRDLTPCSTKGELEKKIGATVLKLINNK